MGVVLEQLVTPLKYLRIKHDSKWYFDIAVPALLSAIFVALYGLAPISIPLTSPNGLIPAVTDFVRFSAGFYITALAAVATFNRSDMDDLMENPPKLFGDELSRRRFLCYLFGYLSFISIALYIVGTLCILLAPSAVSLIPLGLLALAKLICVSIIVFLAMNLVTTTLLGLYFLTDRMVRTKPKIVPVNDRPSDRKAS